MPIHQPEVSTMTICDMVIMDKDTGKKTLVGLFDKVSTMVVPCVHPEACVFVAMSGGMGEYDILLKQVHAEKNETILEIPGKIQFQDPNQSVDVVVKIMGLHLPKLGLYRFLLYCNGIEIGASKFNVLPR